ncbi:MAG: hypothetical protein AAF614_36575 [Chloroflexota bacterium]
MKSWSRNGKILAAIVTVLVIIVANIILIPRLIPFFAVQFAQEKEAQPSTSELATQATQFFWDNFHAGNRERIPEILIQLTAAYLENPNDAEISLLLAHTHLWALAERDRNARDPLVTNHAILAEKYFEEALRLAPDDVRILGWLGSVKLAIGSIHQDEKATRAGYFMLQDAAKAWPEFNGFTAGYAFSPLPATDSVYQEGVAFQWVNLDACAGQTIDRENPDYSLYLSSITTAGDKRTCWNSWIAPYNFEGFFLNMGDMLLKNGHVDQAAEIYRIAQLSESYSSWPYKTVLEDRLANLDLLAQQFKDADADNEPEIMFNSTYNCMACHQK